jgi:DNA-binding winged helix-turn-helix (wHTH) protein
MEIQSKQQLLWIIFQVKTKVTNETQKKYIFSEKMGKCINFLVMVEHESIIQKKKFLIL